MLSSIGKLKRETVETSLTTTYFLARSCFKDRRKANLKVCVVFFVGKRNSGRLTQVFKDVCKRDLKSLNISANELEELADDCDKWRSSI